MLQLGAGGGPPVLDGTLSFIFDRQLTLLVQTYVVALHVDLLACDYCILLLLCLLSLLLIASQVLILHIFLPVNLSLLFLQTEVSSTSVSCPVP